MIVGIGTDIVKISRIKEAYDLYENRFAKKILCPAELNIFQEKQKSISYLAKRFAAKEAASKALGTGIGLISWQDIEIKNNGVRGNFSRGIQLNQVKQNCANYSSPP